MVKNAEEAKGSIFYGLHFYPGLAQYQEEGKQPYRVFLNEDTLRTMDPSFAGRPVFVLHVDDIETDINELRKEADGWVSESFYNAADGKHWAKFIVVSEKGLEAVKRGMKLSNCYVPKNFGPGGTWNGIDYQREITNGVYEHLAIVPNPRYEESVIMTPDEFKKYNEDKLIELERLKNHKTEGEGKMKISWFKKTKVDNAADIEAMSVVLPKSSKEISLTRLINEADEKEMKKDEPVVAQGHHLVDCNGKTMTVNDMVAKHKEMCDAMEEMKKPKEEKEVMDDDDDDSSDDPAAENDDEDQDMEHAKEKTPMPEDDKQGEKKTLMLEKEEEKEVKDAKKKNAKEKAERLKNADKNFNAYEEVRVSLSEDRVARGKSLYGSK